MIYLVSSVELLRALIQVSLIPNLQVSSLISQSANLAAGICYKYPPSAYFNPRTPEIEEQSYRDWCLSLVQRGDAV